MSYDDDFVPKAPSSGANALKGQLTEATKLLMTASNAGVHLHNNVHARHPGRHAKTGQPIFYRGAPVCLPSEMQLAKIGAWIRSRVRAKGDSTIDFTRTDEVLRGELLAGKWIREVDGKGNIEFVQTKASLLDDATSGGDSLVPVEFDEAIVTFPLLQGELFPYIQVMDVGRSSIETASIGNPTLTWGTAEGSGLTEFDATSLVAQITGTIHPCQMALEIGRDFLRDSPVMVGQYLTEIIGMRYMTELDAVIANGNGTDRPQGIFNSGASTVNSKNGTGGAAAIDDVEKLAFALAKQYRTPSWNPRFVMNDTTYKRFRGIPVNASTDARRILGLNEQSYTLLDWPVSIQNDISNNDAAFCCLKKYRLWRRQGMTVETTTEGRTLRLTNTLLLTVRGRMMGKLMDANACSLMNDLPN